MAAKTKIKVWVTMGTKRPAPLQRHFLNANRRLLTIWTGPKAPNDFSVRATLTLDEAWPRKKRR